MVRISRGVLDWDLRGNALRTDTAVTHNSSSVRTVGSDDNFPRIMCAGDLSTLNTTDIEW